MKIQKSACKKGKMGIRLVDCTNIDFLVWYCTTGMYGVTVGDRNAQEISLLFLPTSHEHFRIKSLIMLEIIISRVSKLLFHVTSSQKQHPWIKPASTVRCFNGRTKSKYEWLREEMYKSQLADFHSPPYHKWFLSTPQWYTSVLPIFDKQLK